ncbi:MAG: 30S ribosomal protein S20 [Treponema sp.]|nr:30S ribosomal protein S20 [Treponema sp.]
MSVKKTSAEKRHAQSEVRRIRNKAVKSRCHTAERAFVEAVQKKDKALAEEKYKVFQSELDIAFRKGVKKRNAVARKKSRMMKFFHKNFAAEAAASN